MTAFEGCGTALVTPFTESGAVDFPALGALVEWQIAEGIDFLVPCGSTGEAQTLDDGERERVVAAVVETAAGRVPVVAGATSNDTRRAVDETRRMCAPRRRRHPLGHALLQQAHARTASPATSRPSPTPPSARSASTTSPAAPPSTSSRPPRFAWPSTRTCAGIKEASGDLRQIMEIIRDRPDGLRRALGRRLAGVPGRRGGRRRAHLGGVERGPGADDRARAPRPARRPRRRPRVASTASCRSWTPTSSRPTRRRSRRRSP